MNKKIFIAAITFVAALIFSSCSDDDTIAKPEITIHELGDGETHGDERTAKIGGELHMDIDIVAEGKIETIQVILHREGDHHKSALEEDEWELDSTYTNYSGLKNTTFHEHVDIAGWAEPGEYHFDFIVTDMEGNQTSAESDIELIEE